MNAPDLHTLTGAYATDALPPEERRQFVAHLEACPACADEVRELTATTARLGSAVAAPPPAELRDRVLGEIRRVRQQPPRTTAGTPGPGPADMPWSRRPMAMAAALLLVVSLGLAAFAVTAYQRAQRAERVAAVATDPDRYTAERPAATGGTGTVVAAAGDAVFTARDLDELDADRSYQLWVIGERGTRSAGVLETRGDGTLQRFVTDVVAGDTIGLTVEPRGGSSQPTTEPILLLPTSA